jgi:hypothetical protein
MEDGKFCLVVFGWSRERYLEMNIILGISVQEGTTNYEVESLFLVAALIRIHLLVKDHG